jgi:hypothetical protein
VSCPFVRTPLVTRVLLLLALLLVGAAPALAGDVLREYKSRFGKDAFLSEKEEVLEELVATANPKAADALRWCYRTSADLVADKEKQVEKLEKKLAPVMEEFQEKFAEYVKRATKGGKPMPKTRPNWPIGQKVQKLQAEIGNAVKQMEQQRVLKDLSLKAHGRLVAALTEEAQADIRKEWQSGPLLDKDWTVRAEQYRLIGATPTGWALTMLLDADAAESDPRALVEVLDGMAGRDPAKVLPPLGERLKDVRWTVRVAAARSIEKTPAKEGVDLLIEALGSEDGRLQDDCARALRVLTGEDFGTNAAKWTSYWETARAEWTGPPEPEKELEDGETPDPEALARKAQANAEKLKGRTGFFGIDTKSKRIVYVIDISGSMNEKAGDEGEETRADRAKEELRTAVRALEDGSLFNIVFFAADTRLWKKTMTLADDETRKHALAFIDKAPVGGGTATYDALERGFDLGDVGKGRKRGADPDGDAKVDTIILLSDGRPSVGRTINPDAIRAAVREWNRARRIALHTVAFGKDADHDFMRGLADDSGGTFVAK